MFEKELDELKELRSHCSTVVSAFVMASENSDATTQEQLKSLRDHMSAFKVLDSLESRIKNAHTTIDAHKRKLDMLNKWVALREEKSRMWRKRSRAARRVIAISILVLCIALFLVRTFTSSTPTNDTPENFEISSSAITSEEIEPFEGHDAPLEDIVSWLSNIDQPY